MEQARRRAKMPIRIEYLEDGGVIAEVSGAVSAADLVELNDSLYSSPAKIRAIRYQLCDFTDVAEISASTREVAHLAEQDSKAAELNPDMLIALVGPKDSTFGLSRMWEGYAGGSPLETMVFRSRQEAREWIEKRLHGLS